MSKSVGFITFCLLFTLSSLASAQCAVGPDEASARALGRAFEAQTAIEDHLAFAAVDRESRELTFAAGDRELERGEVNAQAALEFGQAHVGGFSVCDAVDWQGAKLRNQNLGGALGVGAHRIFRFELRGYGVSDSVLQSDLSEYYPEREADVFAPVPGAIGAGHGLWSMRFEVLDEVNFTVGTVATHQVSHGVGWDEETDDDGNTTLMKTQRERWDRDQNPGRTFLALGIPRFGTSDLIFDGSRVERAHAATGWLVLRPRDPFAAVAVEGGWDGLVEAPLAGASWMPLGGVFDDPEVPTFVARGLFEGTGSVVREASVGARWDVTFRELGADFAGSLLTFDVRAGAYGGQRLVDAGEPAIVPGMMARADVAVPIYAVLRLAAWGALNRPETINAVPDAVGRGEWGFNVYLTYAL